MSGNDIESDDGDSEEEGYGSDDDEATVRQKLLKLERKDKKRKQEMTDHQEQLKDSKQAREGKVATKKN